MKFQSLLNLHWKIVPQPFNKRQIIGTHFQIQTLDYQVICIKFIGIIGFDLNINYGFKEFKKIKL